MPEGFALQPVSSAEVVAAFAAPSTHIPSVSVTPGWQVIGEFFLPLSVAQCRLDVIASVSDASLTSRFRLYDRSNNTVVSGSTVQIRELVGTRRLSGPFALTGGRVFQIHGECTGHVEAIDFFAVLQTASLSE